MTVMTKIRGGAKTTYLKPFLESPELDPTILDPDCEPDSCKDSRHPPELDLDELAF